MKLQSLLLSLLLSTALHAQDKIPSYSAFTLNSKEVIWVQVYHAAQPADSLRDHLADFLKHKSWIRNLRFEGPELVADIENLRIDYKRYGGKYMNTSNLIRTGRWLGKVRVSFKDGKYRVIVYGLEYDARQPALQAGKMSNESHKVHGSWTDWVLNKYRTHFRKRRHSNMDIMHFNLKDAFTLTETDLIDEDW